MQGPSTTKFTRPPKILIYGMQGIGKSTIAADMLNPVFIQTTDGLEGLGVEAFPLCQTAQDIRDQLKWVLTEKHSFKTLVIDTLGFMERLIHAEVCGQLGLEYMTQSSMKSYPLAKQKLLEIKDLWDQINIERKMFVCLVGHAILEKFEDPTVASYDRYQLDMNDKCAYIMLQDADIVGFINMKVQTKIEEGGFSKTVKASGSDVRYAFFDPRPAFFAKQHNFGLPSEVELSQEHPWASIYEHMKAKFSVKKEKLSDVVAEREAKKKEIKEPSFKTTSFEEDQLPE